MTRSLVLPKPSGRAFVSTGTMRLSALLTRGWIRCLMKELDCGLGHLDSLFPTWGQAVQPNGSPSTKRWNRWARGECSPLRARTWIEARQPLVTDHAETLVPGCSGILFSSLRRVADLADAFSSRIVTDLLLALPPEDAQDFFIVPLSLDPDGESRADPTSDQISRLAMHPSIPALAGAMGLYLELKRGNRAWACIAADRPLDDLIEASVGSSWWLGEDGAFLRNSLLSVLHRTGH
jgi:hypothetical protein